MNGPELLAELKSRGVCLAVNRDRLTYDAPAGVMTPDLEERIRACKADLLILLDPPSAPETHADREIHRFLRVAVPWPDGRGWYDPSQAPTLENLARADGNSQAPSEATNPRPKPYDRPGGGKETFTERAARYQRECNGLPPGASRRTAVLA